MAASFVGRRGELALLAGLTDAVSAGVGGVILVEGEHGIGKSSLLQAGLQAAGRAGCRVLWAVADDIGQRFPLRLMIECLGPDEPLPTGLSQDPGIFAGNPVLAGVEQLLAKVDRMCAVSPVVLVVEDLQWADEASLLVWSQLGRAVRQMPLLLVGSCRPGTGRELERLRRGVLEWGGNVLELGPLTDDELAQLVGGVVGGRPGRRLAALAGRAGGNPLYARELAEGLVRENAVTVTRDVAELAGHSAQIRVPVSLTAAIGERLAELPDDVVGTLRWAAVLGVEFSVTDLNAVSGRPAGDLIGTVDASMATGVVADAGLRLRFRHGLIREILYEGVPAAERAALHFQAARALVGAGAPAERVAAQLAMAVGQSGAAVEPGTASGTSPAAGGPGRPPGGAAPELAQPWVMDWLAAAVPALIYRAPQVTAELLRGVLAQLPAADPRREELEASLVTVAFLLVREEEVERVGGLALARARDPGRVAEMASLVSYTLMRTGRAAEAAAAVTRALSHPGLTDRQAGRLQAAHAVILTVLGQLDQADHLGRAALATASRVGDRMSAGYALHALSCVCYLRPDHATRLTYIDQALETIGDDAEVTDLRLLLLSNRPAALVSLDRRPEAIVMSQQALVLAEKAGTPRIRMIRTGLAHLYFEAGRWDDAIAELELVVDLPGPEYHDLIVHGLFALIAGHRGDRQTAEEHLAAVRSLQFSDVAHWSNSHSLVKAQALTAEQAGEPARTAILAQLTDAELAPGLAGMYDMMPVLTRIALASGDRIRAEAAAAIAAGAAQDEPLPIKVAVADMCRGLVTGDPAPLLTAAEYFERTDRVLDQAMALEDAAALSAGRGDLPAARQALSVAVGLFEGMGADWDIQRASARVRPYGIRRSRSGSRPRPATGWAALTPTEAKIARLLAEGRSNPDIAAELFLSRNTVQTHVARILAKLGVRSRAEVIRKALIGPAGQRLI
jgi:DNA-binding CsgD family transcriptional regulator/tetratricopeptide (TPR) repeat protein